MSNTCTIIIYFITKPNIFLTAVVCKFERWCGGVLRCVGNVYLVWYDDGTQSVFLLLDRYCFLWTAAYFLSRWLHYHYLATFLIIVTSKLYRVLVRHINFWMEQNIQKSETSTAAWYSLFLLSWIHSCCSLPSSLPPF